MAEHRSSGEEATPPPPEQVHLPGPSYAPVAAAAGITIALIGVIFSFVFTAIGIVIFLVPAVRWIRDVREEMAELPREP